MIASAEFVADVRAGLDGAGQKWLPARWFYDDIGSALFEVICLLPEYGLTRAESRLLDRHARHLAERLEREIVVAELGAGSGKKTARLVQALTRRGSPVTYYAIDVSEAAIAQCEHEIARIERVRFTGIVASYLDGLREVVATRRPSEQLVVLFLGSTIGNFERAPAIEFLERVRAMLEPRDRLVLATDLVKPADVLWRAYDDPLGVTAAFNLNILARINRELGATFDLDRFRHVVRWNEDERRVEMHLRVDSDQRVVIPTAGIEVDLRAGETIWTESSHKYTLEDIDALARATGFRREAQWVDPEWPFAQTLLQPSEPSQS